MVSIRVFVMFCVLISHTQRVECHPSFPPTALSHLSPGVIASVVVGTIVGLLLISAFFCGILVAGLWVGSVKVCLCMGDITSIKVYKYIILQVEF